MGDLMYNSHFLSLISISISARLLWDQEKLRKCLEKEKPNDKEFSQFVKETFNNSPVSRLFYILVKVKTLYMFTGHSPMRITKCWKDLERERLGIINVIYLVTGY